MRSLAEQLLSQPITKLASSKDVRDVYLVKGKCLKIARVYFQNAIAAQSHLQIDNPQVVEA